MEKICGNCKNWNHDPKYPIYNDYPDLKLCHKTWMATHRKAGSCCEVFDSALPDEQGRERPKYDETPVYLNGMELSHLLGKTYHDTVEGRSLNAKFKAASAALAKSRGPEPVKLKDGDVVEPCDGYHTIRNVSVVYTSETKWVGISNQRDDMGGKKAFFNIFALAEHIRKGGRIVLAGKDEVAPVLSKEEAKWLMEIFQAIATSMILKPYKPDPDRTTELSTVMAKLFAAMDKGAKK